MTSVKPFRVINWRDAAGRESHGQEIRDLFRTNPEDGFKSSFDYMSMFILPAGEISIAHVHPDREKLCYVVTGSFDVRLGDQVAHVSEGDTFFIPSEIEHEIRNNGDETAQYIFFINKTLSTDA